MKKTIFLLIAFFFIQQTLSQTWIRRLDGISMWSLCKDYSGKIYAGTSGSVRSIYRTATNGDSWDTVLSGGVTNFLYLASDSSNNIYAANGSNGLLKTTNGGANWTNIPSGVFNNKSVQSVICGKSGYVYVGTITGGIFRSTDNGATFPDNTINTLTIVSLAVERFNSNIVYAGASSGAPPNYGFYRSTDAGATWSGNLNSYNIWGIVQNNLGYIYTVTTSTGYNFDKSTNGGLNWTTIYNLPGAMRGLCMSSLGTIYTAGNGGVFGSTTEGTSFLNWNFTYSSNQIMANGLRIFVAVSGTTNGGVWYYDQPAVGIQQISGEVPGTFSLKQNYPNPFNPVTKIKFGIPALSFNSGHLGQSIIQMKVFDAAGREVETLVNQNLQPGEYEVSWDGFKYPSGVYFYQLIVNGEQSTESYIETKKMVLVK